MSSTVRRWWWPSATILTAYFIQAQTADKLFEWLTCGPPAQEYLRAHSERSAQIVGAWLKSQGASPELEDDVRQLILLHEVGGSPAADVLQAADSISFLETLSDVVVSWIRSGECSAEKAKEKHDWMLDRIRIEPARARAQPFYERAVSQIDTELRRAGGPGALIVGPKPR